MSIFGPKTVDAALAPLIKAQEGLEAVQLDRLESATTKLAESERLRNEASLDDAEAERAGTVLAKLKALTEAK